MDEAGQKEYIVPERAIVSKIQRLKSWHIDRVEQVGIDVLPAIMPTEQLTMEKIHKALLYLKQTKEGKGLDEFREIIDFAPAAQDPTLFALEGLAMATAPDKIDQALLLSGIVLDINRLLEKEGRPQKEGQKFNRDFRGQIGQWLGQAGEGKFEVSAEENWRKFLKILPPISKKGL